jgi:hypothetical protein
MRVALGSAVALLLGVTALLAIPSSRDAVAERLGLKGVKVTSVETATPSAVAQNPTATPAPLGEGLGLGTRMALGDALSMVNFPVLAPDTGRFGLPDAVYSDRTPPGGRVSLVYLPRTGLPQTPETGVGMVLTQFRGTFQPYIEKQIHGSTTVEQVTVKGGRGLWIAGQPHILLYRDSSGQVQQATSRLAANTLLWEQDGLTLRLESSLSRDEALRIAEQIAPIGKK